MYNVLLLIDFLINLKKFLAVKHFIFIYWYCYITTVIKNNRIILRRCGT